MASFRHDVRACHLEPPGVLLERRGLAECLWFQHRMAGAMAWIAHRTVADDRHARRAGRLRQRLRRAIAGRVFPPGAHCREGCVGQRDGAAADTGAEGGVRHRRQVRRRRRIGEETQAPVSDFSQCGLDHGRAVPDARVPRRAEARTGGWRRRVAERRREEVVQARCIGRQRRLAGIEQVFQQPLLGQGIGQAHGGSAVLRLDHAPGLGRNAPHGGAQPRRVENRRRFGGHGCVSNAGRSLSLVTAAPARCRGSAARAPGLRRCAGGRAAGCRQTPHWPT